MRRLAGTLAIFVLSACGGGSLPPPRSPLAQMAYEREPPTLYVGDKHAQVSPYDKRYTALLSGEARDIAERSHRARLTGALLNVVATAGAITAFALVIKYEREAFEWDQPQGRATLGLVIGSALLGSLAGIFAQRGRAGIHRAINVYNAELLTRDFVPKMPEARAEPLPAAP